MISPLRKVVLSRTGLVAGLIALGFILPHLVWQMVHGWPTAEFIRAAQEHKIADFSPMEFWSEQMLMANPGFVPIALVGLAGLLFIRRLRAWRTLGIAFVVVGLWLTLQKAKPYYLAPAFPMIMAAGAVLVEHWLSLKRRLFLVGAVVLPLNFAVVGLAIAPLVIPILSPENFISYEQKLGLRPRDMENNAVGALPQHFADRFGWAELAAAVVGVYQSLPAEDQDRCLIVAGNYGECGAINYFARGTGLPTAVSGHNSCWSWWPEEGIPEVVLVVGESRETLELFFEQVEAGGQRSFPLAMPSEKDLTVWVCRGFKLDPAQLRDRARFYI